ncbi:hypothetical protein PBV87_21855 [Niameybacter massiliensis]|uniref:Uncharacterized protein n=1 Tax=Holtiella tumoricola TaxID=3018743 RepID=A0AA42DWK5_9FIRM|nr:MULTISPECIES: hypothetical protein [Lachnospirales]MDA3734124.1 hypothetical protein [Holtiella tumoricola]
MKQAQIVKVLNYIALGIFIIIIGCAIYIMQNDIGLIEGLNFGPGSYYYSDIPGWEKYFFNHRFVQNLNPLLIIGLFCGWGFICWKAWVYLDTKLK